ncbi:rhodanese-like domain-containing protein [Candidatus Palauibacter sp.]|uniref:rhodanese-like domain-containing protein n=1 Tax=Candidatus Palauibacter sp. TaxID=3101350 RepID=UPI003B012887
MKRHKAVPTLAATFALFAGASCGARAPLTDDEKLAEVERMSAAVDQRFPDVEAVTVEEVGRLLETGSVVLVDAREPREREISWIPGAITSDEFERDPDAYMDRTVVVYCTIGHRSSEYAQRQAAEGRRVLNLRGSLLSWTHAGGPLVGPDGPTNRLHVYGQTWDLAPARFETIW